MPSTKECLSDCLTAAAVFWLVLGVCMPTFGTGRVTEWTEQFIAMVQGTDGQAAQTKDNADAATERKVDAPLP